MSNLAEIVKLKTKNISEQNRREAAIICQEADNLIGEALAAGGTDKESVKQAILLYQESLGLYSHQVKPYMGLAYIMYSMGDIQEGIGFLNKAMTIDPGDPKLKKMLFIFTDAYKESLGNKISRSGKTLSEKLSGVKTDNKPSFFDKITSIFTTTIKPKKDKKQAEDFSSLIKDTSEKMKINTKANPGNFFENIRSTGRQ